MTFKVKAQYLEAPCLNPKHDFQGEGSVLCYSMVRNAALSILFSFQILHNGAVAMTGGQRNDTLTNR